MKRNMKWVVAGLMVMGMASGALAATNVYSKNAVGYISVELAKGFTLMSVQLLNTGSKETSIDEVFGAAMPDNSMLFFYTPPSGPYARYIFYEGYGWYDESDNPVGTNVIGRGNGFWVKVPNAYTGTVVSLAVVGEVPGATTAPTSVIRVASGFTLVGYPYPIAQAITNAAFAASATDNDNIFAWTGSGYKRYIFYTGYGWYDENDNPADLVMAPGSGYWYKSGANVDLVETKPYNWP